MSWNHKYSKDKNKDYRLDWENLKVGDYVFCDSNVGCCSGGIGYGIGMLVTEITENEIITIDGTGQIERWVKKTRKPKQPPTAYFLAAFQSFT